MPKGLQGFQKGHGFLGTEETKRKISKFNKGKIVSEETKKKIRVARAKQIFSLETKMKMSNSHKGLYKGNKHPNWKENKVGYYGVHDWVERQRGKAKICAECGKTEGRIEWANISGKYLRDINDYKSLCKKCHAKFDNVSEKMKVFRNKYNEVSAI